MDSKVAMTDASTANKYPIAFDLVVERKKNGALTYSATLWIESAYKRKKAPESF